MSQESKRISSSRLLKYTMIIILLLVAMWTASTIIIYELSSKAIASGMTPEMVSFIQTICSLIRIDIVGAITVVSSLTVGRYLGREVAANLTGSSYSVKAEEDKITVESKTE